MKKFTLLALLILISATVIVNSEAASASTRDPWYSDVPQSFWAYQNIRTLWEEDVADGFVLKDVLLPEYTLSRFLPYLECTRSQFIMMLVKLFELPTVNPSNPTYLDVPTDFVLYYTKQAYQYIESAHAFGLLESYPGPHFYPNQSLSREEAAVMLIRSLDLSSYAENMLPEEVDSILNFFADHHLIDGVNRPYLATAVKLRILYGYGTEIREIRPKRALLRDEATAILYRSCLARAVAYPTIFNPYGDGRYDTTQIQVVPLKNRNMLRSTIAISSEDGNTIFRQSTFSGHTDENHHVLVWDGTDAAGLLLPPGTYMVHCSITDRNNQVFTSTPKPLVLDQKILDATLHPAIVRPGEQISIRAFTSTDADTVTAAFGDMLVFLEKVFSESEGIQQQWSGSYTIPLQTPEGECVAEIEAFYPYAVLTSQLAYNVIDPIFLQGVLNPVQLRAGDRIHINGFTSDNVLSVQAFFPFGSAVTLTEICSGQWQGTTWIPLEEEDGVYNVQLQAKTIDRSRWLTLQYEVSGNLLSTVRIVLSD